MTGDPGHIVARAISIGAVDVDAVAITEAKASEPGIKARLLRRGQLAARRRVRAWQAAALERYLTDRPRDFLAVEVRGEVYLPYEMFKRTNLQREREGEARRRHPRAVGGRRRRVAHLPDPPAG